MTGGTNDGLLQNAGSITVASQKNGTIAIELQNSGTIDVHGSLDLAGPVTNDGTIVPK